MTYKQTRARMARLVVATSAENTDLLRRAHQILDTQWPVLLARGADEELGTKAAELSDWVSSDSFYSHLEGIRLTACDLATKYAMLYAHVHTERTQSYASALDAIKGFPEWALVCQDPSITDTQRSALIGRLALPAQDELNLPDGAAVCRNCHATVGQMESDLAAVEAVRTQVVQRLQELLAPDERIERVRVSSLIRGTLKTAEDVDSAIERLKEY